MANMHQPEKPWRPDEAQYLGGVHKLPPIDELIKTAKLHQSDERQQADDASMVKYGDQAPEEVPHVEGHRFRL